MREPIVLITAPVMTVPAFSVAGNSQMFISKHHKGDGQKNVNFHDASLNSMNQQEEDQSEVYEIRKMSKSGRGLMPLIFF